LSHGLYLYFLLVLGIVALPGMDMAYVVSSALAGGARCAAAAIAGIVLGGIVHVLAAAIGITALLTTYPRMLRVLVLLGTGYMGWMGFRLLRVRPSASVEEPRPPLRSAGVFKYGAATCLVNPKAYAFMLAVFPSFLNPAGSARVLRVAELGSITATTQIAIYGVAAVTALRLRGSFGPSPTSRAWMQRVVGTIMVVSAVVLARGWL
jgi:threonine/homoserine/homoserine lactone efflux protein